MLKYKTKQPPSLFNAIAQVKRALKSYNELEYDIILRLLEASQEYQKFIKNTSPIFCTKEVLSITEAFAISDL